MNINLPSFNSVASAAATPQLLLPRLAPRLPLAPIPSLKHQRLHEGTHEVRVYLAGATHLRTFLKPLGVTAFKIGITGRRSTWDRIMDLRDNCYAGVVCNEWTHEMRVLEESHDWFQMPLMDDSAGSWDLPDGVTFDHNTITLRVSTAISVEVLDERIHAALAPRDLRSYLLSSAGQARMVDAGYDPQGQLWTNYALANDGRRPSQARELYLIRPRRELRDLIICLSEVVAALERELGGKATRVPPAQER